MLDVEYERMEFPRSTAGYLDDCGRYRAKMRRMKLQRFCNGVCDTPGNTGQHGSMKNQQDEVPGNLRKPCQAP